MDYLVVNNHNVNIIAMIKLKSYKIKQLASMSIIIKLFWVDKINILFLHNNLYTIYNIHITSSIIVDSVIYPQTPLL